jgi:hypothetical protein
MYEVILVQKFKGLVLRLRHPKQLRDSVLRRCVNGDPLKAEGGRNVQVSLCGRVQQTDLVVLLEC